MICYVGMEKPSSPTPDANESNMQSRLRDVLGIAGFIIAVVIGAWLINSLIFRSYSVVGPSMEPTMHTGDRLIVNRLPNTWANLQSSQYMPKRGEIIVFKNPFFAPGTGDEFIVKRVVGLPGERVSVNDGRVLVYNDQNTSGFDPYPSFDNAPGAPFSGSIETKVPAGEIFVIGDNHSDSDSLDSRNGLGTIPLYDVIGPVSLRLFPLDKIRLF